MKQISSLIAAFGLAVSSVVFTNSILAGNTLVRDSIQSEGYVPGNTGWSINRNGTAEFNDVTSRGEVIVGDETTKYISITNDPQPIIKLGTPSNAEETSPAAIDELATGFSSNLFMQSPERNNSGEHASISLIATDDPKTQIALNADELFSTAATSYFGDAALGDELVLSRDANNDYVLTQNGETWHTVGAVGEPAFAGNWAVNGGVAVGFYKEATGRVQLRGRAQETVASSAIIFTLPVGYRPSQAMSWGCKANNDAGTMAWISITTGGAVTVIGNAAAARVQTVLDCISFPTA